MLGYHPRCFQQPIKRTNLIAHLRAAPARRRPPPTKSSSTRSCPTARRYASPPTGPARPRLSCRHPHLPGSRFVTRRRLPSSPRSVRVRPRSTRTYKPPDFPHTRARAQAPPTHSYTPTTYSGHLVARAGSLQPIPPAPSYFPTPTLHSPPSSTLCQQPPYSSCTRATSIALRVPPIAPP